jgi:deoxyadenosine kinase
VIDNIYLADFYQDMKKYSFPLQIYLLNKRFKQQQQIIWEGKGGVQDRTIYEDSVFARMLRDSGHMEERDFRTYMELFSNMSNFMKKPNIIVHLDVSPEERFCLPSDFTSHFLVSVSVSVSLSLSLDSARRIRMRQRDCEAGIPLDYLHDLYNAYEHFIADISRVIPVIKVDYSRFRTAEEMAKMIRIEYAEIANVRHVQFGRGAIPSPPALSPSEELRGEGDQASDDVGAEMPSLS